MGRIFMASLKKNTTLLKKKKRPENEAADPVYSPSEILIGSLSRFN